MKELQVALKIRDRVVNGLAQNAPILGR